LLDPSFVVRKRFDTVCRLAKLKTTIAFEGCVPQNLLALAEASLGIAVIPSVVQTHRYSLRRVGITHRRKPIREPLAIVWDKRRGLPRYAEDFRETLAAHMRERGGTKLG
jgi:LysR family nitrogen assimilation transcriptional regulator